MTPDIPVLIPRFFKHQQRKSTRGLSSVWGLHRSENMFEVPTSARSIIQEPPLAAIPVGDLGRVLAEDHPVEALCDVAHQNLPPPNSSTNTMISTIKPMPPKPPPP